MSEVEVALRREAARRRLAGESPETIAADLGRTRQWVAKWAARYDPHDPSWADGRSGHQARGEPYAGGCRGAGARDPLTAGREPVGTTRRGGDRVGAGEARWASAASAHDRGDPRARRRYADGPCESQADLQGPALPAPAAKRPGDVVQADLIGPRHLDGGARFHALTQIDVASHHAGIEIITDRGDQRVLQALYALWERHGLPRRLQLDNGGPFVSPTGLGEVVRVCLHQQVTLVFIPPREPWRNGTIEHFNNTFQQRFFRQERFDGLPHLIERTMAFERFHNSQHRYKASGGRTPEQSIPAKPRTPRPASEIPIGWPEHGRIEFIRFIRSDLRLRILGRAIPMPDDSAYQYVTATLDLSLTEGENLHVSDTDGQLLTTGQLSTPRRR